MATGQGKREICCKHPETSEGKHPRYYPHAVSQCYVVKIAQRAFLENLFTEIQQLQNF